MTRKRHNNITADQSNKVTHGGDTRPWGYKTTCHAQLKSS